MPYPWCVELLTADGTEFRVFDTEKEAREYAAAIQAGRVKVVAVWEL